jgi:hypothetical protein
MTARRQPEALRELTSLWDSRGAVTSDFRQGFHPQPPTCSNRPKLVVEAPEGVR